MSDDEFEAKTCDCCGSPCVPCMCDCEHEERNGRCVYCAKDLAPVEAEAADE